VDWVVTLAVLVLDLLAGEIGLKFALLESGDQFDAEQGNREERFADLCQQRLCDRQRKRQTNDEAGALAGVGLNQQSAAHGADCFVDHIHADATPGNLGDRTGRWKSPGAATTRSDLPGLAGCPGSNKPFLRPWRGSRRN
jgi:hypothetical protein